MGISIRAVDPLAPVPRATVLTLACGGDHGLLPAPIAQFAGAWFADQHAAAMAAGWLERHASAGRVFLCPACSGKAPR